MLTCNAYGNCTRPVVATDDIGLTYCREHLAETQDGIALGVYATSAEFTPLGDEFTALVTSHEAGEYASN